MATLSLWFLTYGTLNLSFLILIIIITIISTLNYYITVEIHSKKYTSQKKVTCQLNIYNWIMPINIMASLSADKFPQMLSLICHDIKTTVTETH